MARRSKVLVSNRRSRRADIYPLQSRLVSGKGKELAVVPTYYLILLAKHGHLEEVQYQSGMSCDGSCLCERQPPHNAPEVHHIDFEQATRGSLLCLGGQPDLSDRSLVLAKKEVMNPETWMPMFSVKDIIWAEQVGQGVQNYIVLDNAVIRGTKRTIVLLHFFHGK